MPRTLAIFVFLLLIFPQALWSQQAASDVTPLLLPGLGNRHHPISTKNPEARQYFDQGLMLVFGFNRAEAVRSFRRAAQLDPQSPMPHWGMALAYGRHMNMDVDMDVEPAKAYAAIQKALALIGNGSEKEQLYVRALAERCSKEENTDWQRLDAAYAAAMVQVAERYPDDLDALAFSLEARMMAHRYEWFHDDMPQEGTNEVIRQIEDLLRRDPTHPLGNHLHIHILDTAHPEVALGTAYRLGQVAPGLGHLIHMPSHVFFNLGDYEMTAKVNSQAAATDREYMRLARPGYTIYTISYYLHDVHFVSRARGEQGLFNETKAAADQLADYLRPVEDEWPMISDYYLPAVPLLNLLRFQKLDDALNVPAPHPKRLVGTGLWRYGRAMAWIGKGQKQQALEEKARLEEIRRTMPADTMWMFNKGSDVLGLASLVLDARLAEDSASVIERWKSAVKAQDALAYDEPPPWYYPIRESLGAALLRAGNATEAEAVFRECLQRNPRDPRALFGLMETLKAEKNLDAAEWVRSEFERVWKNPELKLRLEDF